MNIFVTVGTIVPFERLVRGVDHWAKRMNGDINILAQIGRSNWKPSVIKTVPTLDPQHYQKMLDDSDLIIGHAGMGTIIAALEIGKPLIVMPRLAKFKEHDTDHQLDTVRRFQRGDLVRVAQSEEELHVLLDKSVDDYHRRLHSPEPVHAWPPDPQLIQRIRDFIRR